MEQVSERGGGKLGVLLVNLGEDDGGHGGLSLEGILLRFSLVGDLVGNGGGELGGSNEGHDVRVVLEDEDVLLGGGIVVGGRSDLDNSSGLEVGELKLESESVVNFSGSISELELISVLIKLEDLEDLGDNIEVLGSLGGLTEGGVGAIGKNVVGGEVVVGPLLESLEDGGVLSLVGGLLSRESVGSLGNGLSKRSLLIRGVESPGALVSELDVELGLVLPNSNLSSVDSDDISESVDDGEVLESLGIDDNLSVVSLGGGVEGGVDDLKDANVSILLYLVGEGGINDHSVEVVVVVGG